MITTTLEAVLVIEDTGAESHSLEAKQQAWQHIIDSGAVHRLTGWYGRTARALIDNGVCHPPQPRIFDVRVTRAASILIRCFGLEQAYIETQSVAVSCEAEIKPFAEEVRRYLEIKLRERPCS